jgi:hypothetical protein
MKQIVIFFGLMTLALSGIGQSIVDPPNMEFFINFSALSNSPPPPSGLSGEADYYQVTPLVYPGLPTYTNQVEVFIGLPEPAEDAWLLEMEEDGSFTPVAELTDPYNNGNYDQFVTLTTNQIHSLVEGKFYAEVDFGDSNYLGNLAPQYAFANGPTAKVIFPAPIGQNTPIGYIAISPNNRTAKFVLDGSHCTDPFYLPMQLSWTGYAGYYDGSGYGGDTSAIVFTSTNTMVTNVFKLGYSTIFLQARDAVSVSWPYYFSLQVVTAGQAVNTFIPQMRSATMPDNTKQALTSILSNAASLFNQRRMFEGCVELAVYEQMVKASHFNSLEESFLLQPVQNIIDAFAVRNTWWPALP